MRRLRSVGLFTAAIVLMAAVITPSLKPVKGQDDEEQSAKKVYVRTGQEGAITGTILFNGEAPPRRQIDMSQDSECAKSNRKPHSEELIVTKGKLANAFVYIRSGHALDAYLFETPQTPAVLDQKRCVFAPHVLGIQAKQTLHVLNSDETTHNVNIQSKSNEKSNQSHVAGGAPIVRTFARPEILIPIKCNQHPWMKAYLMVLSHPFFAVSARDGSYRIEGLPPGDYTLMAWHEKLGEKVIEITVLPGETKPADFTFEAE